MTDTDITDTRTTTARIIDIETGAVELREFASAAEARRTFAREADQLLVWEHQETRWTATLEGREYQVDMDHIKTEEEGPAEEASTLPEA